MSTPVIAHGNTAPIFEFSEHIFNFVTFFIEICIVFNRNFAVLFTRDTGHDMTRPKIIPDPIRVIASTRQKNIGLRQRWQQECRPFVIADLAFR